MSDATSGTIHGVTGKVRLARDRAIVGVADAVNSGVDAARVAKDKVSEGMGSMIDQGKDLAKGTTEVIRSRPWTTVAIALGVGYVIAKLSRRR